MPVNYIQTIWLYIKVHGLKDERAVQIEDGTKYLNENCFKAPVSTQLRYNTQVGVRLGDDNSFEEK